MATPHTGYFAETELIITPEKKVYHIQLSEEEIAEKVIVVGDQGRVEEIANYFSKIEHRVSHREFFSQTGWFNGKRLTVLSTGIGTDNIDIVLNELDAAINIDLQTRTRKAQSKSLEIVRLGTSGALQADIPVNGLVVSSHAIGLDGLMSFYDIPETMLEEDISQAFISHLQWPSRLPYPYCVKADDTLFQLLAKDNYAGITATAPGFYGPQGRTLRLSPKIEDLNEKLTAFQFGTHRITNFEMETSALYGLGKALGHRCATVCVIIANRVRKEFTSDYKNSVKSLITGTLERLTA